MQILDKLNEQKNWLYTGAIILCTTGTILGIFILLAALSFIFPTLIRIASIGILATSFSVTVTLIPLILKTRALIRKMEEEYTTSYTTNCDPSPQRLKDIAQSCNEKLAKNIAEANQRTTKEPKE